MVVCIAKRDCCKVVQGGGSTNATQRDLDQVQNQFYWRMGSNS